MSESIYYQRLLDRDLWVDGESSLHVDAICNKVLEGSINFIETDTISTSAKSEVKKFINLIDQNIRSTVNIKTKESINELDTSFTIPEKYHRIDLEKRIIKAFKTRHDVDNMSTDEVNSRLYRVADELEIYTTMGLLDVLKCVLYIVDTMKRNNIVWGPGRGSACCSYILYLLEVHDIDSFAFDLSIDEFLR